MKKWILIVLVIFSFGFNFFADEKLDRDKESIKVVIKSGYVDGFFNEGSITQMKKCFHDSFVMFSRNGENLSKMTVDRWYEHVKAEKKRGKYPVKERVSVKFLHIDVTLNAAMVKIALIRGGKRFYTDYLSFYKFPEGWRLVSKIYQ
ncbi:MAG: nuclear transport factor 2 family protein [Acidobacteriota bacterium]